MIINPFSYKTAFCRNLGLISEQEQEELSNSLVVIAGCGGVGGMHAHTLARLGVGRFRLADFDEFSVANFNRQMGANINTVDREKVEVTAEMIRSINPNAEIDLYPQGLQPDNADDFVAGAKIVVDGIDFFALPARRLLFKAAEKAAIPALTAAPLGFSGTLHTFMPGGMNFDDYFQIHDGQETFDSFVNFLLGLAPSGLHVPYMDLSKVDPSSGRGPSSVIGSQIAGSLIGVEALRIILNRGGIHPAPWYRQVDLYRCKFKLKKLNGGNNNWLQKRKRKLLVSHLTRLGLDKAFAELDNKKK